MTKTQKESLQEIDVALKEIGNLLFSALMTNCFVCGSYVPSIKNKLEQAESEVTKIQRKIELLQSET